MYNGFTLGMATFRDTQRTIFTTQSALIHHAEYVKHVVVVDNDPEGPQSEELVDFARSCGPAVTYVAMKIPQGTAAPRNAVAKYARCSHVVWTDPHVLFYPNAFKCLRDFYVEKGDDCADLVHGPMMVERTGVPMATHMNEVWREEMWGVWGMAWKTRFGKWFSTIPNGDALKFVDLDLPQSEINADDLGLSNNIGWAGHERVLIQHGCKSLVQDDETNWVETPGHGFGVFACTKSGWLPFCERMRGFGGEEITHHYKFRQAGRKVWCVKGLKWWHNFTHSTRRDKLEYDLSRWTKVRNYIVAFQELGLPLEPVFEHFVGQKRIIENDFHDAAAGLLEPARKALSRPKWLVVEEEVRKAQNEKNTKAAQANEARLFAPTPAPVTAPVVEQPVQDAEASKDSNVVETKTSTDQDKGSCNSCQKRRLEREAALKDALTPEQAKTTLEAQYLNKCKTASDINEHLPKLRELASQCSTVVELGTRNAVSTTALLAGQPTVLVTYDLNVTNEARMLSPLAGRTSYQCEKGDSTTVEIPDNCDLLFVDTDPHTEERVWAELSKHKNKLTRYVVFHDTEIFGERYGEQPGVMHAVRRFLKENKEYSVVYSAKNNNGLLVISKDPRDKPALPGVLTMAANFAKAKYKHALNGSKFIPLEMAEERLSHCEVCPERLDDRCSKCGCFLTTIPDTSIVDAGQPGKVFYPKESCPMGKWSSVD